MLTPRPTLGDSAWFVRDRFGMFIHWGLYALPARHEWVQSREEIAPHDYRAYFERFNPRLYDPQQWARLAREAGMKYAVLTAKHHEGFCLWDSALTDYKATCTPWGKDLVRPFVDAFRAEGLRIGFYYSLLDWHHPDFPIDIFHPLRNHPQAAEMNAARDMRRYAAYMRGQVRELLSGYGAVDILWLDFSYPGREYRGLPGKGRADWESEALVEMIRQLNPRILLNNRLDLPEAADFYTPEQVQPLEWVRVEGEPVVWEACHTFSGSWGYHRDESTWKSPEQLIRLLVDSVSLGGNLLMNVGPTALGTFDPRALRALLVYRDWTALHGEAVYGCTQSQFNAPRDCRLTQKDGRVFVHVFAWPFKMLVLPGMAGRVKAARFLHDGSEVSIDRASWERGQLGLPADALVLELPVQKPDVVVPVIELLLS